jgi:hypothetical protein
MPEEKLARQNLPGRSKALCFGNEIIPSFMKTLRHRHVPRRMHCGTKIADSAKSLHAEADI